tara:strand:- start:574 stop:957 length:384 start_codon:yes stop_codon:yes gene_type:complete
MVQNISWKTSSKSVALLMVLIMACSCSLLPTKQIQVTAKPLEKKIVQPIMPREIDLKQPGWIVVTPDNWEEQLARIEDQEGELVFLAMTIPDYEVMAYNMQEIKRYITELKDVVVYYRKVTTKGEEE